MTTNTVQTATAPQAARIPIDTLANRLVLARAQAGHISIREAADRCGVGRGAWTNWEKGAQPERIDQLVDLIAERLDWNSSRQAPCQRCGPTPTVGVHSTT